MAYGVDHIRMSLQARPSETDHLNEHLDLLENTLVGALGAPEVIEPLIVLSGGLDPVARLYERTTDEYLLRCEKIGLGDRRERSPLSHFLELLQG